MIFDTHAHYDDKQFDEDRDLVIRSLREQGITNVVNVACDIKSCESTLKLAEKYPSFYAAVGVHPSDIDCLDERGFEQLKRFAREKKVVAIGEIGLDYYWEKKPAQRKKQQVGFAQQLILARQMKLPIIVHSRDAAEDTLAILKKEPIMPNPGVIHCFSYSKGIAMEYVKRNYFIGVGGVVTYKNGRVLKEVVEMVPLEHIVLETDCPYLAPDPNRGKRNTSRNLGYVAHAIAGIKGVSIEEVVKTTEANAKRLYQLK